MDVPADLNTTWIIAGLLLLALIAFGLALAGWRRSRRRQQEAIPPAFTPNADLDALGLSTARPVAATLRASRPDPEPAVLMDAEGTASVPDDEPEDDWTGLGAEADPPEVDASAPEADQDDDQDEANDDLPHVPFDEDDNEMDALEMETDEPVMFDDVGVSAPRPVMKAPPSRPRPHPHLAEASPLWSHAEPDAVGYLLESLWATLGAQSIALLRHDAGDDVFAVEALVSRDGKLHTDPFPARNSPLRSLVDDESALAVLEGEALAALRYHTNPRSAVGHAVALPLPGTPGLLLVADGSLTDVPFTDRQVGFVEDYADLFGRLFDGVSLDIEPEADAPDQPEAPAIRTRADIIAEEMAAARAHERPLALALVVPQNSEEIASEGPEAVAEAAAVCARGGRADRSLSLLQAGIGRRGGARGTGENRVSDEPAGVRVGAGERRSRRARGCRRRHRPDGCGDSGERRPAAARGRAQRSRESRAELRGRAHRPAGGPAAVRGGPRKRGPRAGGDWRSAGADGERAGRCRQLAGGAERRAGGAPADARPRHRDGRR